MFCTCTTYSSGTICARGTYIDGITLDKAFLWKKTIGPYWERPGHDNAVWGYWSDDVGLRFLATALRIFVQ